MQNQLAATEHTERHSLQHSARLHGRWLRLARVGWIALVALALGLFGVCLPFALRHLHTLCTGVGCADDQLTPELLATLRQAGLSLGDYAMLMLTVNLATALIWWAVAAVIIWRKSDDWLAQLVALALVLDGATVSTGIFYDLTPAGYPFAARLLITLTGPALFLVFSLFPSGRFAPRWMRWVVLAFLLNAISHDFFSDWPFSLIGWSTLFGLWTFGGMFLLLASAQLYRYRAVSTTLERQQTKWIVVGLSGYLAVLLGTGLVGTMVPTLAQPGSLYLVASVVASTLASIFIPLSFAIAILRYRLWDIDLVINRTLVYGTLTVSVIGLYMLVVVGLGSLIQLSGNLLLSLLTTGLIAVLFQPARARLQLGVNHVLYGERDEPALVLSRLGHRLEATLTPEAVLPAIVETVAQALKLPAAAITWTTAEGGAEPHLGAIYGELHAQTAQTAVPLVYQQERVGDLVLALRKPGEALTPADQRFLRHLAPQIGVAVHAVRLTADLKHLTADLQRSRTELVTAREEERRRLRRDLHDGLGSVLASLNWRAGALRPLVHRDPVAVEALLVEQQHTIQAAIADIRRLVYDLRPPALDELGLIGALREQTAKLRTDPARDRAAELQVEVEAPETLPALPAAVEVAAYRIAQEALTNIARHAQAHHASLRLACTAERLEIELQDDGVGLPAAHPVGVGLLSMRERAAEVGGSCEVQRVPEGGTRVHAVLPLPRDED